MRCEEKVPNGKMVAIDVQAEGGLTTMVRITGDFFLHPEDALERIEGSLTGVPVGIPEAEAATKVDEALGDAQLIGATPADLARIFRKALR